MGILMSYFFPPSKELLSLAQLRAEEEHTPDTEIIEVLHTGTKVHCRCKENPMSLAL
jgi:hypothetical protein